MPLESPPLLQLLLPHRPKDGHAGHAIGHSLTLRMPMASAPVITVWHQRLPRHQRPKSLSDPSIHFRRSVSPGMELLRAPGRICEEDEHQVGADPAGRGMGNPYPSLDVLLAGHGIPVSDRLDSRGSRGDPRGISNSGPVLFPVANFVPCHLQD